MTANAQMVISGTVNNALLVLRDSFGMAFLASLVLQEESGMRSL